MPICRYKCWRSVSDKNLHLICREGGFDQLPDHIRQLGPWAGSKVGEVERLRPHYRALLAEQGFVVVHRHPYQFEPEP
jgi:hypothetical protein